MRDDVVHQVRRRLCHAPRAARRAKAAPLAAERDELVVAAVAAAQAQESVGQDAALQERVELVLHELRQVGAGSRLGLREEGRGMLLHRITVAASGTLYVTLSTGIARVEPGSGEFVRLPQPDSVVTGGIDGLYWDQGDLIGVQNGTNPGRVIRIALADEGRRIDGITVLQSHHHAQFAEPTTGAIADGALYVIANSYVGLYQPDGTIKDLGKLRSPVILAVPLRL
jgi:hypothetical protein